MPGPKGSAPTNQTSKNSTLGMSPAAMMARTKANSNTLCPKVDVEFDPLCDPQNPKTITYKEIKQAAADISDYIPKTPLQKSRCCKKFGLELYYKIETLHKTGSFSERGALNSLLNLTQEQKDAGVVTASFGNFGMALAYQAKKLRIKSKVVLPVGTPNFYKIRCKEYGAKVLVQGENYREAKREAMSQFPKMTFINGYDNPSVIAGSGTIGMEIMDELPEVDAILVPVGGGALIAGIAEIAKHINPSVLIYGIEPDKCCCFFKAMEKEGAFETEVGISIARALGIPTAGWNSYQTAYPHISKMVLVDDDWITRAVCHFAEEEKLVLDGAGATSLSALFAIPDVLPELQNKTVVCIMSGGNVDILTELPRCMERAKAIEGRLIKLEMKVPADDTQLQTHIFSMIANVGGNVINCYLESGWIYDNDLRSLKLHLMIETRDLEHACQLKRVMNKLFPDQCNFMEEPFSPIPICVCYPKKKLLVPAKK